jgi:predicted O-methyltransferase YrrM
LDDHAELRQGEFADAVPRRGRFDLVFLDGDHDMATLRADVALALSVLKPGGLLACHDYPDPNWADVRRVVDEVARTQGLVRVRQADYLGVFQLPGRERPRKLSGKACSNRRLASQ